MGHTQIWWFTTYNTAKGEIYSYIIYNVISTINLHFSIKANVTIVSREECNEQNSYNGDILESMICAAAAGGVGGVDACQGDSGGPLVALNPPNSPSGDDTFKLKQKYNVTILCRLKNVAVAKKEHKILKN